MEAVRNHWRRTRSWHPKAQEAVDWACSQFPPETQIRGINRGYYEFLWNLDEILKYTPAGFANRSVMDVGCGAGVVTLAMQHAGARVTAVDTFDEYGRDSDNQMGCTSDILARFDRWGVTAIQSNITKGLPGRPGSFDLITSFAVVEHLHESPSSLLSNMYDLLKPGGYIVITTPNLAWVRTRLRLLAGKTVHFPLANWWHTPFHGHIREYTMAELQQMLLWSGFTIERKSITNWVHCASRINGAAGDQCWTTRFTLNSLDRWLIAFSLLLSAPFPSLKYSMLVIGRKPLNR